MITRERIRRFYAEHGWKAFVIDSTVTCVAGVGVMYVLVYVVGWPFWSWLVIWLPLYVALLESGLHPAHGPMTLTRALHQHRQRATRRGQ